jgi:hypothetical protein
LWKIIIRIDPKTVNIRFEFRTKVRPENKIVKLIIIITIKQFLKKNLPLLDQIVEYIFKSNACL